MFQKLIFSSSAQPGSLTASQPRSSRGRVGGQGEGGRSNGGGSGQSQGGDLLAESNPQAGAGVRWSGV